MFFFLKSLSACQQHCHQWWRLTKCSQVFAFLFGGVVWIQAQSPLDDTDHDRFPDVYETQMGGNAANPSVTPSPAQANYITVNPAVPSSVAGRTYTTVQAAIGAITPGAYGVVVVKPGTYTENIVISGKHVLLLADSGSAPVVLASQSSSATFTISSAANDTVLDGFVLSRIKPGLDSRGAYVSVATTQEVAFKNCVFRGNKYSSGAGVYLNQGVAWITHCTFAQNEATTAKAIYVGSNGKLKLQNSILWDVSSGAPTETYRLAGAVPANEQIVITSSIIRG